MASPLIIKPLALSTDKAMPIIMTLAIEPLRQVKLRQYDHVFDEDKIRHPDLTSYERSPMQNRSESGSALEAFMNYAGEEGFE